MSRAIPNIRKTDRLFFSGMASACALITFLGFLPSYYGRSAALPPLPPLYLLHGALCTAWIVLLAMHIAAMVEVHVQKH